MKKSVKNRKKQKLIDINRKSIIIWALYDDAQSSYKNAISKYYKGKNIIVYSIGINDISFPKSDQFFYKRIDLSLNNFNLINELKQLPKPDIILASPPCESWSGADCGGRMFRGFDENGNWIVKNEQYYDHYNEKAHPVKQRYFIQKERGRLIGESTIGGTIQIIRHFNPDIWIIENPQTSKMWEFQEKHWNFDGIKNLTYYSSYDNNFSTKPTIFKSNKKLSLRKQKVAGNKDHMARGSYGKRSSIPELLVKDIIDQAIKELN